MCTDYEAKRARFLADRTLQGRLSPEMLELFWTNHPDLKEHIYQDYEAPIIRRTAGNALEVVAARWGFPPTQAGSLIVNVRNTEKPFWHKWLEPERRCVVPATAFAEWSTASPKTKQTYERTDGEIIWFAGIWRVWSGDRGPKKKPIPGEHLLFAFLTTEPNGVVGPHHQKAMPVILERHEVDTWLTAPTSEALKLQRPLPDKELKVVERVAG